MRRWPDFELERTWNLGIGGITALATAPRGNRVVVGTASGTLHVFSTIDWGEITMMSGMDRSERGDRTLVQLSFSDDERILVARFANGYMRIWRHEP